MAKQGIFTGSSPNDGTGDSLALGAIKVNQNFDEVYSTFGDGNNLISYVDTAGVSTVAGNLTGNPSISVTKVVGAATSSVLPFLWSNYSDLPTPGDVHGAVAHVHETGKLYYAHGRWVELVNINDDRTVGTGTENYNVGVITATTFYGDGSQLTGIAATGGGGGIGTDGSINTTGIITASAFVGDGSGLTGISADSAWVNINLPGDGLGTYGQPLGIHTTKHVGIGTTADSATVLHIDASTVGSAGTPYALRVDGDANINNVRFQNTNAGFTGFLFPSFQNVVGGDGNGYGSALQYNQLDDAPFHIRSHSKFTRTVQIGTSFYDVGDGAVLYPGIFMDGGSATIAVGAGITINGQSGVITATSFSGDGSALTGISTFSGDYNDLINQPSIPSISGLASEGYVDSATANSANWDTAYGWGDHSTAGYITTSLTIDGLADVNAGAPTTGHVLKWSGTQWIAAADQTAAGAGIGLSDLSVTITSAGINSLTYNNITGVFEFTPTDVSGFSTFSGDYNDLTNQPSIPSIAGLASEGYVDNAVSTKADLSGATFTGVSTFQSNVNISGTNQLVFGNSNNATLSNDGTDTRLVSGGKLFLRGDLGQYVRIEDGSSNTLADFNSQGSVDLYYNNSKKFETTNGGAVVTGILTATSFSGDGSALTNISASVPANLTATTLNVSGVTTAANFRTNSTTGDGSDVGFAIKYYVTSNGSSSYRFAGPGLINTTDNPTLYLHRGFTYIFENSTGGSHPFRIQFTGTTTGVGTYVSGSQSGTQVFTIPFDAPSSYEYQCTLHGGMKGTLAIPT